MNRWLQRLAEIGGDGALERAQDSVHFVQYVQNSRDSQQIEYFEHSEQFEQPPGSPAPPASPAETAQANNRSVRPAEVGRRTQRGSLFPPTSLTTVFRLRSAGALRIRRSVAARRGRAMVLRRPSARNREGLNDGHRRTSAGEQSRTPGPRRVQREGLPDRTRRFEWVGA